MLFLLPPQLRSVFLKYNDTNQPASHLFLIRVNPLIRVISVQKQYIGEGKARCYNQSHKPSVLSRSKPGRTVFACRHVVLRQAQHDMSNETALSLYYSSSQQ